MRIHRNFVVLSFVFVLSACSSLNPFSSSTTERNKPAALSEIKQPLAVNKRWSVNVGKAGEFQFSPVLIDDSIVAAAADGALTRVRLSTGAQIWRISAGIPLSAGAATDGSIIVVAGAKGTVLAYAADGKLRWKAQAPTEVLSVPAVGQGLVVVRSIDNQVTAFDVETGTRKWVVQRPIPPLTLRAAPGIVIAEQTAYVGLAGGRLSALSLVNGAPKWEVAVGEPKGATELERIADIAGNPVLVPGSVCATAYQGRIGCFDQASGTPKWVKPFSTTSGIGASASMIFASDERNGIFAMSKDDGKESWRTDRIAYRGPSPLTPYGQLVAVADRFGFVHFLSAGDGSIVARAPTDGSAILSAPLVANTYLIVQTQSGTVTALSIKD